MSPYDIGAQNAGWKIHVMKVGIRIFVGQSEFRLLPLLDKILHQLIW